jgi:uncharacterized membrane protein
VVLELVATLCTALFAGAAIYINLVEHPARMECGTSLAVRQWRPSYRRATLMQAGLALVGCISGVGAWLVGRGVVVLLASLVLGTVIPFTLIVILPTNHALQDPRLDVAGATAADLLVKWNRLHAVRSAAALVALLILLLHLGGVLR